jgi:transcription-repair coupling factor (superfamily II helicase)
MNPLLQTIVTDSDLVSVMNGIRGGMREQLVAGLSGSARQVMIAALFRELQRPILVVTHNMYAAQKMADDLQECLSQNEVLLYPANELIAAETAISSPETSARRLEVLLKLAEGFRGVVVVPFAGVRRFQPDRKTMAESRIDLRVGDTLPMEGFLRDMVALGYERVDRVEQKGHFSVRGGIVDFFPLASSIAYRVEWFDDEIDSIRTFDPTDQRSIDKLDEYTVRPCREYIADRVRFANAAQHAHELLDKQLEKMSDRQTKERLTSEISREIELLRQNVYFPEIYKYISLLYPEHQTLLDYIPRDTLLFMDEPNRLGETARQLERDEAEWITHLLQQGKSLPGFGLAVPAEQALYPKGLQTIYLSLFVRQIPHTQPQNIVNFVCRSSHALRSHCDAGRKHRASGAHETRAGRLPNRGS